MIERPLKKDSNPIPPKNGERVRKRGRKGGVPASTWVGNFKLHAEVLSAR